MFKLTFLACLVVPLISTVTAGYYHASATGNVFYVEQELPLTWESALFECSERNMSLLMLDSEKKQLEISRVLSALGLESLWTGGLEAQDLKFIWITTGDGVIYSNWREGEPRRAGNETQCIGIYRNQWTSYGCSELRYFICEGNSNINVENFDFDANQNGTNNQVEESSPALSNDMEKVIDNQKLDRGNHTISELKVLLDEKQSEISDLKNQNEQHLQQLATAKGQLKVKSKEIEMEEEINEIKLGLLEDKCNIYMRFVAGIMELFKKLEKPDLNAKC